VPQSVEPAGQLEASALSAPLAKVVWDPFWIACRQSVGFLARFAALHRAAMAFHLSRTFVWQALYPFLIICPQGVPFLQSLAASAGAVPAPSSNPTKASTPVMFLLARIAPRPRFSWLDCCRVRAIGLMDMEPGRRPRRALRAP